MARRFPFGTRDVLLAVFATALQLASPRSGSAVASSAIVTGAFGAALYASAILVQGVALLYRRMRPVHVLGICVAAYAVTLAVVPGVPPYASWFALFAAGVYGEPVRHAWYALLAGSATLCGIMLAGAALQETSTGDVLVPAFATVIVSLAAAIVRSRRAQLEALRERAAALERESASASARAAAEERLRIARDIHDLVGHGLSGIAVQSSTARMALEAGRLDDAASALSGVESGSRSALHEMRQLLGILRSPGEDDRGPAPGTADLPALIERTRLQGIAIEYEPATALGSLSPAVSLCIYRVVQEALTNVVKHSPGAKVTVTVRRSAGAVHVTVDDFADRIASPPSGPAGGHGLIGMRERVSALGGSLVAGAAEDHIGWRLAAHIPVGEARQ